MVTPPKATDRASEARSHITVLESVGKPDPELVAKALAPIFFDWLRRQREREKSNDKDPNAKN